MAPYTLYTWYRTDFASADQASLKGELPARRSTPNGWTPNIFLEELGLDYNVEVVDIVNTNAQKEPEYLSINPNGQIPALVDNAAGGQRVFESGAILWYLAEKEDKEGRFWPKNLGKRAEIMSWLMWAVAGVGPMQGQAILLVRLSSEKNFFAMERFVKETQRLYGVLDAQLAKTEYLAGGYSLADIAVFGFVAYSPIVGIDCSDYPNLSRWFKAVYARPAVKKGLTVPSSGRLPSIGLEDAEQRKKVVQESRDILAKAEAAAKEASSS